MIGTYPCLFEPFQLIPYSHNDPPTKFTPKSVKMLLRCTLRRTGSQVKLPGNTSEMDIQWLDRSYVNFTVLSKDLYFKSTLIHFSMATFFSVLVTYNENAFISSL